MASKRKTTKPEQPPTETEAKWYVGVVCLICLALLGMLLWFYFEGRFTWR